MPDMFEQLATHLPYLVAGVGIGLILRDVRDAAARDREDPTHAPQQRDSPTPTDQ